MSLNIEILNMKDVGEPARPYDFCLDQNSTVGKIFISAKETDDIRKIFKEKLESKDYAIKMHLSWMITAYREHGKLRLFCGDITQLCYGEIIREWLNDEISKLKVLCGIF